MRIRKRNERSKLLEQHAWQQCSMRTMSANDTFLLSFISSVIILSMFLRFRFHPPAARSLEFTRRTTRTKSLSHGWLKVCHDFDDQDVKKPF